MSDVVLMLLRHFPSIWNDPKERRFTGWVDIGLARGSYEQGIKVGALLAERSYVFDICYTSQLRRATKSAEAVLKGMDNPLVTVVKDTRLNERRYGDLEGMTHTSAEQRFGKELVRQWRRSFREKPPHGESLEEVVGNVASCWSSNLAHDLASGKRVLVVAHGNSLRALVMYLTQMSPPEIERFEIPTGVPLVCNLEHEEVHTAFQLKFYEFIDLPAAL